MLIRRLGAEAHLLAGLQGCGFGIETIVGLTDIGRVDGLVVVAAGLSEAAGHGGDDAVADELLHPSGITEVGVALDVGLGDGLAELGLGLGRETVVVVLQQAAGDGEELLSIVILELVFVREASHQSGIGVEHGIHLLQVSGEDDQHVGIRLREYGEQRVDDTRAEVLAITGTVVEGIGLVDEEHIASGLIEDGLHVLFGLADVTAHESGAVDGDDITPREQAQRAVDAAELLGDGGLAGSRIAGEDAVEGGLLRGGQSPTASFGKELGVVCHPTDALLHLIESDHLVQVAETLFVGRPGAGELVEAEVVELDTGQVLVGDLPISAVEVAGLDLFDNVLSDIVERPCGENAFATALEQRVCQSVHRLDGAVETLGFEGLEEGVYLLEILGRLLFQTVVFREEGTKRWEHIEHGLDVLSVTAEPKQITALVDTDLLDDLLDDDLATGSEQRARIHETDDVLSRDGQFLEEHLVGIVTGGVEERAAVDGIEREVVGHQRVQPEEQILGEVAVARANQQMTLAAECLAAHTLAELVVDLELAMADDEVADLPHARPLGDEVPVVVVAVDGRREDVLRTTGQTRLRIGDRGLQLVVEGEGHLDEGVIVVVADIEHVAAWQPDDEAQHCEHDRPGFRMLGLVVGLGVRHRIVTLTKDVQLESFVGEVRIAVPSDGHRNVAIDIGRTEQVGLDLDLHLLDFRNVVALASESRGVYPVIIGRAVYGVFIFGIRIIRGCIVQEILEELVEIVITWLVVELQ